MLKDRTEEIVRGDHQYELRIKITYLVSSDMFKKNRYEIAKKIYSLHSICSKGADERKIGLNLESTSKCDANFKLITGKCLYEGDHILGISTEDIKGSTYVVFSATKLLGAARPITGRIKSTKRMIDLIEKLLTQQMDAVNSGRTVNSHNLMIALQTLMQVTTNRKFSDSYGGKLRIDAMLRKSGCDKRI